MCNGYILAHLEGLGEGGRVRPRGRVPPSPGVLLEGLLHSNVISKKYIQRITTTSEVNDIVYDFYL